MFHRMDQNTSTLVSRSQKDSSGPKPTSPFHTLKAISRFTHAAKYVLILLLAFSVAWFPLLSLISRDAFLHYIWLPELNKKHDCLYNNTDIAKSFGLQECIYNTFRRGECLIRMNPDDPLTDSGLCFIIVTAYHGRRHSAILKLTLIMGMMNSIMNPIIYAFWYSQFRLRISKAWQQLFRKFFK